MSYCRWSDDDHWSDIYCYESVHGGYCTHVASNRVVFDEPLPPKVPFDAEHEDEWWARYQTVTRLLAKAKHAPIGLPYDGESFVDSTPEAVIERLEMLRAAGYNVPQWAIDALLEEQAQPSGESGQ